MLLFNWGKVYETALGSIHHCNLIMRMLTIKQVPKNKNDPIYKYSKIDFRGDNFLIHPDILLFNAFRYEQRDIAVYYSLASIRSITEYINTKKVTLNLEHVPVELDTLTENRLLRIEEDGIHFKYEEVNPMEIH